MTPIDVEALPVTSWKNGGGLTRTLAISPPEAAFDDFDWRISIAEVASSARFSAFPGVDRTILLLDGAGMILGCNGRVHPLTTPFTPYAFSGDDVVRYRLVNGATRDFNVMTRRGRAQADVKIWPSDFQPHVTADTAILYCARGACHIDSTQLHSGQALRIDRPDQKIHFVPQTPDALTIAVLIRLETR